MIYKPLIFVILTVVGVLLIPHITWAANVIIDSNAHFTFTLWYGSNQNNVQPTWENQGVGPGRLDYNQVCCSMPEGWYTWNITGWPSGYRLVGIDGSAYQQAGTAYWNVRWEPLPSLTVSKSGTGSGTVTGSGINCGGDCNETYNYGVCVEYFHSEDPGSTWGGWSGACTGPGCVICFDSNKSLTATFNSAPPPPPSVSVSVSPSTVNKGENVTVTWSVSGSVTGCSATGNWPAWSGSIGTSGYSSTTTGGLTTNPTTFGVSCTGPGGTGSDSKSVTVNSPPPPSVSVSVSPSTVNKGENVTVTWSVSGSVTGCSATGNWPAWSGSIGTSGYSSTTTGGLTTNPTTFGVSCTGPGGTGSDSKSVTVRHLLNVSKSGSGSGTVTGSGINCGSDCSEFYLPGACVEYFHSENPGSTWGGWSGACTGPGCVICFDSNKSLTATFNHTPTTGLIQGYKVPNTNSTISSQTVRLDGGSPITNNPYGFTNVSAGNHTVSVTVPSGWSVGYTLCYNSNTCHGNTPTPGSSVTVSVPAGGYVDLYWHYVQPTVSIVCTPTSIPYNTSANVSWSSANTSNCTISPALLGSSSGTSGSGSTGNLIAPTTTYTATCTSP